MTSDAYQSVIALFDGQLTRAEDDLATAKAKMEAVHGLPTAPDTEIAWTEYAGTRCARVTAAAVSRRGRYLLYFRGGAFIAAGGSAFLFYAEMLSRQLDASVVMVDYRMAPMHRYPAALLDCVNAYTGLVQSGVAAASIAFIGDSCGGGLALCSLLVLRERCIAMPACAVSLCGWFDMATPSGPSDLLYNQAYAHRRGLDYAGDADLRDPLISPVFAALHGLPPLLLQTGGVDPTREHAQILQRNAHQAGVDATLDVAPGMVHGFQGLANLGIPESVAALLRARHFVDRFVKTQRQ